MSGNVYMFPGVANENDNPFVGILVGALERLGLKVKPYLPFGPVENCSVLHVHWPEKLFQSGARKRYALVAIVAVLRFWLVSRRIRLAGGMVSLTYHNAAPHDAAHGFRAVIDRFLYKCAYRCFDTVFVMARSHEEQVIATFARYRAGTPRLVFAPHFTYPGMSDDRPRPESLGNEYDVGEAIEYTAIAVGQIRRYKGLVDLAHNFLASAPKNWRLIIAGGCSDVKLRADLESACSMDPRVQLILRPLSQSEVEYLHVRADLAIFNFTEITNSGSVMAAISAGLPIVAPKFAVLDELASDLPGYPLQLFEKDRLGIALADYDWDSACRRGDIPAVKDFSPESVARLYAGAFGLARPS